METSKVLVLKFKKSDNGIYTLNVPDPVEPVVVADVLELANHIIDNEIIKFPGNIVLIGLEKAYIQQTDKTLVDIG